MRDSSRGGEAHAGKKRAKFGCLPTSCFRAWGDVGALAWIGDGGFKVQPGPSQVQTLHWEKSR